MEGAIARGVSSRILFRNFLHFDHFFPAGGRMLLQADPKLLSLANKNIVENRARPKRRSDEATKRRSDEATKRADHRRKEEIATSRAKSTRWHTLAIINDTISSIADADAERISLKTHSLVRASSSIRTVRFRSSR